MDAATVQIPGFTAEQTASLQAIITAAVNKAFNKHFGPLQCTQQSTPPAPQEAKKEQANSEEEAEKQEQGPLPLQPLYQATVEDMEDLPESATKHGNSMVVSKSMLSTMPRLCTTPASRDPAACLSNALLSAYQYASFLASFLASFSASQFCYIEYSEGMEATGQG